MKAASVTRVKTGCVARNDSDLPGSCRVCANAVPLVQGVSVDRPVAAVIEPRSSSKQISFVLADAFLLKKWPCVELSEKGF